MENQLISFLSDDLSEGFIAAGLGILAVFGVAFLLVVSLILSGKIIKLTKKSKGLKKDNVTALTPQKIAAITACINSYYQSTDFASEEPAEFIIRNIKRR